MTARLIPFAVLCLAAGCGPTEPKVDSSVTDPEVLYQTMCARCHARAGKPGGPSYGGSLGPSLEKIGSATGMTAEYITEYIADSGAKRQVSRVMPVFRDKLTEEQRQILGKWLAAKK